MSRQLLNEHGIYTICNNGWHHAIVFYIKVNIDKDSQTVTFDRRLTPKKLSEILSESEDICNIIEAAGHDSDEQAKIKIWCDVYKEIGSTI